MQWLALLKAILQIANYVGQYVQEEHLMDAGEARVIRAQLEKLGEKLKAADAAREKSLADSNAGGLHADDGYKRD